MNRIAVFLAAMVLTVFTTTGLSPQPAGHWEMSYVSNDWSDWSEVVVNNVVYGSELNPYHLHPWGEWIDSLFYDASSPQNLTSNSEGVVHLRFDWVGGGTPPATVTFDVWTEAYAWLFAPNGYDDLAFEVYCDGEVGKEDIYSTGAWVEATNSRQGSITTYGASTVHYYVGITNNMSATIDYESHVSTLSVLAISNIQ